MEPLEVLHEIVEADKAARKRVADALQERESFTNRLEDLRREITETEMSHAREAIDAARLRAEESIETERAAILQECDENVRALKQRFEEKKDEGVEKLFRLVVGLDD